jgi:hypothetical protein
VGDSQNPPSLYRTTPNGRPLIVVGSRWQKNRSRFSKPLQKRFFIETRKAVQDVQLYFLFDKLPANVLTAVCYEPATSHPMETKLSNSVFLALFQ